MSAERSRPPAPRTAQAVLWGTLFLLYVPLAVMFASALLEKSGDGLSWTLRWFAEVFADHALMEALQNSFFVAVVASLLSTVLGTLGALGLRHNPRPWRWTVEGLSVVSLIFPEIVFALSLLSWFFIVQMPLGLTTVVIAHVTFSVSYVLMTVSARLAGLDPSLEDAARDLGASEWQVQKTVVLPLLLPAIGGGFILSFLLSFDDFLITYFVNGVGQDTLPVKLYTAMKIGVTPKLHALSTLMFLWTLFILIFFFRSPAFRVLFEGGRGRNESDTEKTNL